MERYTQGGSAGPAGGDEQRRIAGELRAEAMHLLDSLQQQLALLREDGTIDYSRVIAECETLVREIRAEIECIDPKFNGSPATNR
jgi:hypothetical protein